MKFLDLPAFLMKPPRLPGEGVFHFERREGSDRVRIHLRIEADGKGVLLVNAARLFHLNPTAAAMAYMHLNSWQEDKVIPTLTGSYRVPRGQARSDYQDFIKQLNEIIRPDGACPVCELELETTPPFSSRPSAPYRMDMAITYRCNNNCSHCYNARPRQQEELRTDDWKRILDGLWSIGVPHIVFTGGEPSTREDLPELIAHAEKIGQITGINTNGRKLKDAAYVQQLVNAGLDHVQITLESADAEIHDSMVSARGAWVETVEGIRNALDSRLFVMTNTTLLQTNRHTLEDTLELLASIGVPTVGLNALIYSGRGLNVGSGLPEKDLPHLLEIARSRTQKHGQRLIWYTPTQYCHFNPTQLELGVKGCTAALYNMCIEPDGSVIPCQSYYKSLGKFLEVPWQSIWNHDLAVKLRERQLVPQACNSCSFLPECGGGCPLAREAETACDPVPVQPQFLI